MFPSSSGDGAATWPWFWCESGSLEKNLWSHLGDKQWGICLKSVHLLLVFAFLKMCAKTDSCWKQPCVMSQRTPIPHPAYWQHLHTWACLTASFLLVTPKIVEGLNAVLVVVWFFLKSLITQDYFRLSVNNGCNEGSWSYLHSSSWSFWFLLWFWLLLWS